MGEGGHLPLVSICTLVSIYSYKLTVSNLPLGEGVICLWYLYLHWYSFCFKWERGSFAFGIYVCIGLYIFL